MIEFAFDFNTKKQDGSFELPIYGEANKVLKHRVVDVYDTNTGVGPAKFYVANVTQQMGTNIFVHKLVPLPKQG